MPFHVVPPSRLWRRLMPPTIRWLLSTGLTHNALPYHPCRSSSAAPRETTENVAPPVPLRSTDPPSSSADAYTTSGWLRAYATSIRPAPEGIPVLACQVRPPSAE